MRTGGLPDSSLLTDAVRTLSSAADATQVLDRLARLLVLRLGDFCLADRLDDPDVVTRVAAVGRDGLLRLPVDMGRPHARRSSAHAGGMLTLLRSTPQSLLRLSAAQLAELSSSADPRIRGQAAAALALGAVDLAVLGLTARNQLVGVLTVGSTDGAFPPEALAQLADLGLLAGLALDAVRLLDTQRHLSAALQTSLLPPLPALTGLSVAARYAPAAAGLDVGGDWYDVFTLDGSAVGLVIGDTTGHDTTAAARMAELRNLLRALAVDRGEGPAQALSRLDRTAARLGVEASATCVYARLDPPGGPGDDWRLRWSSAGHLPPVLLRDGRAELLETPPDLMLGVDPGTVRGEHERNLRPGDLVVLCTDGLVEDRVSSLDERLAVLARTVQGAPSTHPEAVADLLLAELAPGGDDVAVLVVRVDAG